VVGSTVTFNGHRVYGGPFYANASMISQDFAYQFIGAGTEATTTSPAGEPSDNLAAVDAVMATQPNSKVSSSQIGQKIPSGGVNSEGTTLVAALDDFVRGRYVTDDLL
jgi:hypothetical protein